MKKWDLVNGILLAVLGLLLIIFPGFWVKLVVLVLGLAAIIYGIYNFKTTKIVEAPDFGRSMNWRGVISLIMGVCAIIFPFVFKDIWNLMVWFLIIYLVVSAVLGFYAAALLRNTGVNRSKYIFENFLLLVVAVALLVLKLLGLENIVRIIGIIGLIIGGALIAFSLIFKKDGSDVVVAKVEVKDDDGEK